MKYLLAIFMLLILSSSVFAGTLIAGGDVKVKSNYQGFEGLNLLFTWQTNPGTSDSLTITNSELQEEYKLDEPIKIKISEPEIEQVFIITNPQPIYEFDLYTKDYYYIGTSEQDCLDKIYADPEFKKLHPDMSFAYTYEWFHCIAHYPRIISQKGYVGKATTSRLNYDATINFEGTGKFLRLNRDLKSNQISDSINNFAFATLLNIGQWTNAELTDNDLNAYSNRVEESSAQWRLFEYSAETDRYKSYLNELNNVMSRNYFSYNIGVASGKSEALDLIENINQEANKLTTTYGTPRSWTGDSKQTTSGNYVNVEVDNIYTSQIQLLVNGEEWGLKKSTGIPEIIDYTQKLTFNEVTSGFIDYKVKNVGEDGAFSVYLECSNENFNSEIDEFQIDAGRTISKELEVYGSCKETNANEETSCKLIAKDQATGVKDEKTIDLILNCRTECVEGTKTNPIKEGDYMVVYTLKSNCDKINPVKCLIATSDFKREGSEWVCVEREGDSNEDEKTGDFSITLLVISLILGLIGGSIVASYIPSKTKTLKIIRVVAFIVIMIAITLIVPIMVNEVIGFFRNIFTLNIGG